jgi:hypothetical protein
MPTIAVGAGQTYATRQLAFDTLSGSDQGGTVIAQMYGDDTSTFTASGVPVNPWEFEDNTTVYGFTSATESLLPKLNATTIQSENITFRNVLFQPSNNFVVALTVSADNVVIENYRLIAGTSANGRSITTAQSNTFIRNGVESGGVDVSTIGFADGCNVNNVIKFGGSDKGAEGAGSTGVHFITDCFSFGNTGDDIEASVFTVATSATEDVSGGTLSGYTSSELVDFAGGDYRTKATSFLATAGTGGSFIGAALEASSSLTVTGGTANFDYNAIAASVDLTGSIEVTGSTANFNYSAITGLVDLTGELLVIGQTANFNYVANPAGIDLTGEITVTGATSNFDHIGINGVIELGAVINVVGQTANFDINGVNAEVSLTGEIIVTGQTAVFNYTAMAGTVVIGTGQKIGKVTAGFAESGISVQYKQSTITVKFGE